MCGVFCLKCEKLETKLSYLTIFNCSKWAGTNPELNSYHNWASGRELTIFSSLQFVTVALGDEKVGSLLFGLQISRFVQVFVLYRPA